MMRKLGLALFLLLGLTPAQAQNSTGPAPVAGAGAYNSSPPTCTAGQFCFLQTDANGNLKIVSSGTPSGTQDVNITKILGAAPSLTNPLFVSPATGAVWSVTPTNPVGITPTDRTITSATGASQTVAAANATRHGLIVQNTGNANCGINPTGGTAVIGGAGTLTLVPNGSYQPRIPTLSAVTAICTAGQPLYAEEN